ncbi:MAG: 1,4-alpha-glucan branching protein, partial [Chitinophagaceae bacterium]
MSSRFKAAPFLGGSNIYCVNLRQYTAEGNFTSFQKHLPRLRDMGVQILWFMPIHPIGLKNRKGTLGSYYSIKDFEDVNPEYGNRPEFAALVQEAHALGMKVILDWVANHTAWDNKWTGTNPEFFEKDAQGNF